MNINTHLEDFSNEIFFEIFDYLHTLDIFTGFASLNRRISSILQSIPLHIVISRDHSRRQIDFLSSHLTFHEHQVISIEISDIIRDDSSIIRLLFNRHNFRNLKSCKLMFIKSMTRLGNIIEQIASLNSLVILEIFQPDEDDLNENGNDELTRIVLTHKSSSLRSVQLRYPYHYLDISNYPFIGSYLTLLNLRITGSVSTVSVHSVLRIFRFCHRIRYLRILLQIDKRFDTKNIAVPSHVLPVIESTLPMVSQMTTFELTLAATCDIWSISNILRCMPNLKHFYFHLMLRRSMRRFIYQYLDGYVWQHIVEHYLPCLSQFEFHMIVTKRLPMLNLDLVIKSFNYFVNKYSNWDMIIDRWTYGPRLQEEYVMLRTLNFSKSKLIVNVTVPDVTYGTFERQSTRKTIDDHSSFYSDITALKLYLINERSNVTWSSPLFQHVTDLLVEMPLIKSSWWNNLFSIVNFGQQTTHDNNDAQQTLTYVSRFVHLSNITELEFPSTFPVDRWKDIQYILQACPNVIILIIDTPLLLLSKLIDNLFLIPIFKQIKMIKSITETIYFPSSFALKFVQRFPSLIHTELKVFTFDICSFIIDIFLTKLEKLSYLKIDYNQDTLLDDTFSREYIIAKRRQVFPVNLINEQMANVKNNGQVIQIWLP